MVYMNYDFGPQEVWLKLLHGVNYYTKFLLGSCIVQLGHVQSLACILHSMHLAFFICPRTAPTAQLLTSHIISNDRFQSGDCMVGADMIASFILLKALRQVSSKTNGASLASKLVSGLAISENFYMNLR